MEIPRRTQDRWVHSDPEGDRMLSVLEAAKRVLEEEGRALTVRDITAAMIDKGYWQTQGLTPEATVQARLATERKTGGETSVFVRPAPGRYGLRGQVVETDVSGTTLAGTPSLFDDEELDPAANTETLSFTEAAVEVLQELNPPRPLHYREITQLAIEQGKLSTKGQTPDATMYAQILTEIDRYTKRGLQPRFKKLGQGLIALSEIDFKKVPGTIWTDEDEILLKRIQGITSGQFEMLVAKLLAQIFGAEIKETQMSGDAGVDAGGLITLQGGIKLKLVAQAKKYTTNNVQRPEIQNLRGSMGVQSLGVFITTTGFSRGAVTEAVRPTANHPIGLINGKELVGLMKEWKLTLDSQGETSLDYDQAPVLPEDAVANTPVSI